MWDLLSVEERNHVLLKYLVSIAKSDSTMNDHEYTYLVYVCQIMNINTDCIKTYIQEDSQPFDIFPFDEMERVKILYHLLFTIKADDVILPEEEIMIYQLSFKLGFHEDMTRDFIELMKTHKLEEIPKQSMIAIIKKYQN